MRLQRQGVISRFDVPRRGEHAVDLDASQQLYYDYLTDRLDEALQDVGHPVVRFLTRGAGSGKTALVNAIVRYAITQGGAVLRVSPTGKLVHAGWRHDRIVNATVCAAFGMRRSGNFFVDEVAMFDLWVVGEVGMLTREQGDIINAHWKRCDSRPILVFEGDFQQLPPGVGLDADVRSCRWCGSVIAWELRSSFRCRDPALLALQRVVRQSAHHSRARDFAGLCHKRCCR